MTEGLRQIVLNCFQLRDTGAGQLYPIAPSLALARPICRIRMGRGSGAWPGPPPSPPPTQRVTLRAPVVSGVLPLPPLGGASQRPAGLLRGTGRALVVEAWSRSRRHRLWLRLCAREPGREGGARSRECSCGCVETLGAAEPALAAARPELTAETKATVSVERAPRWPRGPGA